MPRLQAFETSHRSPRQVRYPGANETDEDPASVAQNFGRRYGTGDPQWPLRV